MSLILDGAMAALLIAVIVYCVRLDKRLAIVRKGQAALGGLADKLSSASEDAQRAIEGMKAAAKASDDDFDARIKALQDLGERLSRPGDGGRWPPRLNDQPQAMDVSVQRALGEPI